jgi:hypothetical protein
MGLIIKKLRLQGDKGAADVEVLFDTGSSASFIRRDVAAPIATLPELPKSVKFEMGRKGAVLEVSEMVVLFVTVEGVEVPETFFVSRDLAVEAILGAKAMQFWKIKLDPENEEVSIDPKAARLKLLCTAPAHR